MLRVSRLSFAPVRALGLLHPASIDVDAAGVREDRRFYLIDQHGHIIDQLRASALVQVKAETDPEATWLRLTFPDGRVVEGNVTLDEPVRTHIYGREADGHVVGGPWAAALEPYAHGRPLLLVRCDRPGGTRILGYRGFRAGDPDKKIDFGVLGDVAVPGRIAVGDEVRVVAGTRPTALETAASA